MINKYFEHLHNPHSKKILPPIKLRYYNSVKIYYIISRKLFLNLPLHLII